MTVVKYMEITLHVLSFTHFIVLSHTWYELRCVRPFRTQTMSIFCSDIKLHESIFFWSALSGSDIGVKNEIITVFHVSRIDKYREIIDLVENMNGSVRFRLN